MVGNFPAEAHSLRAYAVRRVMAAGDYFTASIMDLKNAIPPPVAEHPFPWLMVFSVAAVSLMTLAIAWPILTIHKDNTVRSGRPHLPTMVFPSPPHTWALVGR